MRARTFLVTTRILFLAVVDEEELEGVKTPSPLMDDPRPIESWAANLRFLDRTIARGDNIILGTPLNAVKRGSYFERELKYLASKGYRPNVDGRLTGSATNGVSPRNNS